MNNWKSINSEDNVLEIIAASNQKTQIIFKDSTTCGISAHAKSRLVSGNELLVSKADFNYLDLLGFRAVSNFIATELKVTHQSPQIIVLKNEQVVYSVTHHAIEPKDIEKHL